MHAPDDRDHLAVPDQHLDPDVAAVYDSGVASRFTDEELDPTIALLTDLAGDGPVVEFAVGTGRVALPLAQTGLEVHGIDFSAPMLAELAKKPGAEAINVIHGDMTTTQVCSDASLAYLVFNTIGNLRTQRLQIDCFKNAAAHLAPGGRFLVETMIPRLRWMPAGGTTRIFHLTESYAGFDEIIDFTNQISVSHHYRVEGENSRVLTGAFRYVWPSELDLMAELAGLELEHRWADFSRREFTDDSIAHVSVWHKAEHDKPRHDRTGHDRTEHRA